MQTLLCIGRKIKISNEQEEYVSYRNKFVNYAQDAYSTMETYYTEQIKSLEDAIKRVPDLLSDIIDHAVGIAIEELVNKDIFTYNKKKFYEDYEARNFNSEKYIKPIIERYQQVLSYQDGIEQERAYQRAGRSHWEGGGFGLGGAVKGAAMAGAMNLGTGLFRGIGDSMKNSSDRRKVDQLKRSLFQDPEIKEGLVHGVYSCCIGVFNSFMRVMSEEGYFSSIEMDYKKSDTIYENVKEFVKDRDKIIDKMIECINLYPYNEDYYFLIANQATSPMERKQVYTVASAFGLDKEMVEFEIDSIDDKPEDTVEQKVLKIDAYRGLIVDYGFDESYVTDEVSELQIDLYNQIFDMEESTKEQVEKKINFVKNYYTKEYTDSNSAEQNLEIGRLELLFGHLSDAILQNILLERNRITANNDKTEDEKDYVQGFELLLIENFTKDQTGTQIDDLLHLYQKFQAIKETYHLYDSAELKLREEQVSQEVQNNVKKLPEKTIDQIQRKIEILSILNIGREVEILREKCNEFKQQEAKLKELCNGLETMDMIVLSTLLAQIKNEFQSESKEQYLHLIEKNLRILERKELQSMTAHMDELSLEELESLLEKIVETKFYEQIKAPFIDEMNKRIDSIRRKAAIDVMEQMCKEYQTFNRLELIDLLNRVKSKNYKVEWKKPYTQKLQDAIDGIEEAELKKICGSIQHTTKEELVLLQKQVNDTEYQKKVIQPYLDKITNAIMKLDEVEWKEKIAAVSWEDKESILEILNQCQDSDCSPKVKFQYTTRLSERYEELASGIAKAASMTIRKGCLDSNLNVERFKFYFEELDKKSILNVILTKRSSEKYEYPIFFHDSSMLKDGAGGFMVTTQKLYSIGKQELSIPLYDVSFFYMEAKLLGASLYVRCKNNYSIGLSCKLSKDQMEVFARIMSDFFNHSEFILDYNKEREKLLPSNEPVEQTVNMSAQEQSSQQQISQEQSAQQQEAQDIKPSMEVEERVMTIPDSPRPIENMFDWVDSQVSARRFNIKCYTRRNGDKFMKKLNNAINSYACLKQYEAAFILIDDTIFGNAKEGLVITNQGIYSKSTLSPAFSCRYEEIVNLYITQDKSICHLYVTNVNGVKEKLTFESLKENLINIGQFICDCSKTFALGHIINFML